MNIGRLKAEIADLPDDMEVSVIVPCSKTMYCRSLDAVKSQIIDDECLSQRMLALLLTKT